MFLFESEGWLYNTEVKERKVEGSGMTAKRRRKKGREKKTGARLYTKLLIFKNAYKSLVPSSISNALYF